MRNRYVLFLPFLLIWITACSDDSMVVWTDSFRISISDTGHISSLQDESNGKEYASRPSPLMQIRKEGVFSQPILASPVEGGFELTFEDGTVGQIQVQEKGAHATFELVALSEPDSIELVLWGPYASSIDESIGETVGIARGETFAIGIQALNIRTLGGYPWNENDAMPQKDLFEDGEYHDIDAAQSRYVLYRVEAAKPDSMGSSFQAYTRNRSTDRVIENRGYDRYVAPAFEDEGMIGSKIALFGVPVEKTLETIGAIEIEEGLPHPMIDGEWGKEARSANAAYIIMGFSEEQAERAISLTEQAGLRYLYHDGPFETWGHFGLKKESFPDGMESLKRVVDRAAEKGIMIGTHNLSNFVTPTDLFVTPVPDSRLAKVGSTKLIADISRFQPVMMIEDPGYFNQAQKSHLAAAQIGDEIITFSSISATEPWQLRGVQRGAFGTRASKHEAGSVISKLDDHGYKVFLTEIDLSLEMARNLAELYNEAGLRQISFDGLEGNRSTGMGNYGESLFTQEWYDHLNDDIRSHYIADASRTTHFFWHMYTRMNWGEPWYAGFRESQTEYRLKNQAYFQRNLMPGMLGWFKMTEETSVEDMEWLLSLAAGYDAGFGFVTSFAAVDGNGVSDIILEKLGQWESLRMDDVFSEDLKAKMRSRDNEFELDMGSGGEWTIAPISVHVFRRFNRERQPGEPEESIFEFTSEQDEQYAAFILSAEGGSVEQITLGIDNNPIGFFDIHLDEGDAIVYKGGDTAILYSKTWQELDTISVDPAAFKLPAGSHSVALTVLLEGDAETAVKLEFRVRD